MASNTETDDRILVPIGDTQHCLGGLGRTTIYRLIESGELTRVNIGRRAFITSESISAFVARQASA